MQRIETFSPIAMRVRPAIGDKSMAEPLKSQYGTEIVSRLEASLAAAWPAFPRERFRALALEGFLALELMDRGRHLAQALEATLPTDFGAAAEILIASMEPAVAFDERPPGMASFFYLPHAYFVARNGLAEADFEAALRLNLEITLRFSAEFSIRPYLEVHPARTLARLREWAEDPRADVRRLVSEGTRPRLPWASRLRAFQKDPAPVLELLELLRDDPSLYVRRSVANNLNDIGKDHPEVLVETARRWMVDASAERKWIVRHALRSLIKAGHPGALAVLGYGDPGTVEVRGEALNPAEPRIGESVEVQFTLHNPGAARRRLLVDFRIHFVKANGTASPKVFKLKELTLAPGASTNLRKRVSLAELSTRRHYPGVHRVDLLLNGQVRPLGTFALR